MTLSTDEIAFIRLQSGDCGDNPIVSDAQIQNTYAATDSECATIVTVIRARLAAATARSGVNSSSGEAVSNPATTGIKDLLEYWTAICPDVWAELTNSTIDLGIDEELDIA
jgi:hypothetical protein